jgi:hypothetical protein
MTWPTSVDYGALGVYSLATVTGTMAAGLGAGSEIWQLRWTHDTNKCLIHQISFSAGNQATAFTAGHAVFDLIFARAFTADGTGGGTATITTNNGQLRTDFPTTGLGSIRTATTAALGAGTKTLDAQALTNVVVGIPAVAGSVIVPPTNLWIHEEDFSQPIVLEDNEGLIIRATVPATGTWTAGITVRWSELQEF